MKSFQHQQRSNSWGGSKRFAFLWSNSKQRPTLTVFPFESNRTVAHKPTIGVKTSTRVEARVWATRIKICEIRYTVKGAENNQGAYKIPHWWNFETRSLFERHWIEGIHRLGADIPLPLCLSERLGTWNLSTLGLKATSGPKSRRASSTYSALATRPEVPSPAWGPPFFRWNTHAHVSFISCQCVS